MSPADYRMIRVEALLPHPHNPRTDLGDPQKLAELANDIAENGNTIRLRVVPILEGKDAGKFLLIEGHRRTEAAKLGGVHELLCWVDPSLDTLARQLESMLRENTHREGITASNEAKAIQTILDCEGMSVKKVAKAIHRSESFIRKRSRLAGLPAVAHQLVDAGGLTLEQSEAFDEFKDEHDAYQELILQATNPHRRPDEWDRLVKQLRTKRDAPATKAASEALIKELTIPTLDRNQTYSGHYNRDYQAERRTDEEHAAAGEFAFINENSGQIEWYKKASSSQAPKTPPTEEEKEARRKLKDIEAGLEQDLAMWDEHLRRCLTDAGGGLPLTDAEKRIQAGIAPAVLRHAGDYEKASRLIHNKDHNYSSAASEELRRAVSKLRPLQLAMVLAELHLKPSLLHKPSSWDTMSYLWREAEGTAQWIRVRRELFGYEPAVFEQEAMDHFAALKAKSIAAAGEADEDQEEDDDV